MTAADLAGKTALVTGGTQGIAFAVAEALLRPAPTSWSAGDGAQPAPVSTGAHRDLGSSGNP